MNKKQIATMVRTEATPPPDQIETITEPVKKGPMLFSFPDPQEMIGDFVNAFFSLKKRRGMAYGASVILTARGSTFPTMTTFCRSLSW